VETSLGEILIPLAVDICTNIDTNARRIDVILPMAFVTSTVNSVYSSSNVPVFRTLIFTILVPVFGPW